MYLRTHASCLFTPAPVADCGRDIALPPTVLASSWPLALFFVAIAAMAAYAYLRVLYQHEIEWESGDEQSPSLEDEARRRQV